MFYGNLVKLFYYYLRLLYALFRKSIGNTLLTLGKKNPKTLAINNLTTSCCTIERSYLSKEYKTFIDMYAV